MNNILWVEVEAYRIAFEKTIPYKWSTEIVFAVDADISEAIVSLDESSVFC